MMFNSSSVLKSFFGVSMLAMSLCLTGCGENLFSTSEPQASNLDEAAQNATTEADFVELISAAARVINSSSASDSEKANAYFNRGFGTLGKLNVTDNLPTTMELFSDIVDTATNSSSNFSADSNLFNLIDIGNNVSLSDIASASSDLNQASQLTSTLGESLTGNEQMTRGIANSLLAVKTIKEVYNIDSSGALTPINSSNTTIENIEKLMNPGSNVPSIVSSSTNAIDAFDKAGAFSESQSQEIKKIKSTSQNVENLYNATRPNATSKVFSFNNKNGVNRSYDLTSGSDADTFNALNDVFKDITN